MARVPGNNHDKNQTMKRTTKFPSITRSVLGAFALLGGTEAGRAEMVLYYVGQDRLATLASGTFRGLPNPNAGRLTLLYAHPYLEAPLNNHYHSIGIYTYTGTSNAPVVVPTNANHRIPEISTGQAPLTLVPSTNGPLAGKRVNATTVENYSDPRIRSVHRLLPHVTPTATNHFGYGSAEYVMFHSGAGRWTNSLAGTVVAMELVEKSPGLHVGTDEQPDALVNPGDRVVMGDGDTFEFRPLVWTEADAVPGTYSLQFKLVDVSGGPSPMGESGIVTFLYRVQPEPELSIARTVTLSMPAVTDGHVLEEATSADGPWTPVADAPILETIGGGHSAAQTGFKTLTRPGDGTTRFYRLRRL